MTHSSDVPARRPAEASSDPATLPLRVAVHAGHDLVVLGLVHVLAESSLDAVVVPVDELPPADVVLVDTQVDPEGWSVVEELLDAGRPVIIFSWRAPTATYLDFVPRGLVGYLSKGASAAEVVRALRRVAEGGTTHPSSGDMRHSGDAWPGQEQGLTAREGEILALILRGLGNDEIAAATFLSVNTVKSHIRTAYRKMGTTTRAQAITWGVRRGLAAAPDPGPGG